LERYEKSHLIPREKEKKRLNHPGKEENNGI